MQPGPSTLISGGGAVSLTLAQRAVGVLLCHLPFICHQTVQDRAQIWNLRVSQKNHEDVRMYLDKIAEKRGTTVEDLVGRNRIPTTQLRKR
jgi:hypothetical protein